MLIRKGLDYRFMITRRSLITATSSLLISSSLWKIAFASESATNKLLADTLAESKLIYLTPFRSDGKESKCQSEVWFVADDTDVYVVTAADTWRARAAKQGLSRTKIWAGDVGVWSKSKKKYRELPSFEANCSLITDKIEHNRILDIFGSKYSLEWLLWGPRFKDGLKEGSRVMLKYQSLV